MTTLFELAIETARLLPPERQDEIARLVLRMASENEAVYVLSAEERANLQPSLEQVSRREFATEEQVKALWAKHGL